VRAPLGRAVAGLLPLQLVVKAVEASFPLLLAVWFGRSALTDVYTLAWAVFALAGSLVFSAFQDSAVVPVLAELRLSQPALVPVVRGSLLAHTLVLGGALAVAFGGATAAWLSFHYTGEARSLALASVPAFGVHLVALSVRTLLASLLHAEHRYTPLPLASATGAVVTVAVLATTHTSLSIVAIPVASAAGETVAAAVLAGRAQAAALDVTLNLSRPEPVRRIARLVASEVSGGAVTRLNPIVDQVMASLAGVVGGGTMLRLAGDVASVPTSLLQAALLPVLLTHLSEQVAARDAARVRATLQRTLAVIACVMVLATAALWTVRAPLLALLFEHGAMDTRGVAAMARILPFYLVGLAPFAALLVLVRAHVALQNSRIMFAMGVLNALLNLGFDAALVRGFSLEGLALATSVTHAAIAAILAVRLRAPLADLEGTALQAAASAP
jgi:putative peptidoglycan lipid II flippase